MNNTVLESSAFAGNKRRNIESGSSLLYSTATTLFLSKGFHGVSLRKLGDQLGIHAGSLYHHFESKQALLFDLLEEHEYALAAALKAVRGATPKIQLLDFIKRYLSFLSSHSENFQLAVLEHRNLTPNQQVVIRESRERWQHSLNCILQQGKNVGLFAYDDLRCTKTSIIAMLNHLSTLEISSTEIICHGQRQILRMLNPAPG
ncbi:MULTISPECIES: TetR/AcrR family transcriptional regulator [unclassified Pseudomonas]|uniref:TetR/AcrR family transcriptional regulator n=1 Tax=unclassified Pseudomonas TaxID=196821 RepID=UPI0021BDD529|nr:TetR/AcrR family transcriptional regulator [Pseudomonas sp. DR48]